ncbi:hypothetical protein [Bellilinea caldifistulae]|uniref:hypothetical protein n=1 Tax=Bellilinea caldifistulae TaxID=360411 RepID=UPI00191C83FF|nr:hypothetical protein [Bellilinea caldifistulae]
MKTRRDLNAGGGFVRRRQRRSLGDERQVERRPTALGERRCNHAGGKRHERQQADDKLDDFSHTS